MRARSQVTRTLLVAFCFFAALGSVSLLSGRAFFGNTPHTGQPQTTQRLASQPTANAASMRSGPRLRSESAVLPNFDWKAGRSAGMTALFAPNVSVTKTATLPNTNCPGTGTFDVNCNGFVNPGDTLMYSVVISNTAAPGAGNDALNVIFTDQLNGNLSLSGTATASPIVVDESYDTIGNTQLQVAGTQTIASPGLFVNGSVLSNDIDPQGGTLTVTAITNGPTTQGGTVTLNTDGTFIYTPQAGDANVADTFTYTVNEPDGKTATGTVTINIANARVWYVRNNASSGGLGRSGDPFDTLAEAETASAANDIIYVFFGNGTTSNQSLGIALKSGQRLIGEGVALAVPVSVNGGPNPTVLRAAGMQPMLDHTTAGSSAVSATDVIPAEIAGLNLAGNTNAIDWTTNAAFAGSGTLLIHDNTVRAAGAEGIDLNAGGTGSIALGVYENLMTATGNALDIMRTNGTLTITTFHDNLVSGNTVGTGIAVTGPATFDVVPGGGINPVPGGTTVIGAAGNGVGGGGLMLTNVSGELSFANTAMGTIGVGDLDIFADGGAALTALGGAGGLDFSVTPSVGTLVGPTAATIALADINLQLNSLTSTTSTPGVSLTSVSGQFSAPSGSSITKSSGGNAAFSVDNSAAGTTVLTVTYGGTINNSSATGRAVSINNADSGSSISFTGQVTDTGQGVSLTTNTGATITFSGGLVASTGANAAFTATGGGTVNVCDENPCNAGATGALVNTLTTTTGTALNVANTTIGANNLEFRSISAGTAGSGPTNGIVLNSTGASGSLVVKGNGGTCSSLASCTGGGIQSTTSHAISLTSTLHPQFTRIGVQNSSGSGIEGTGVTNFTLQNSFIDNSGTGGGADDSNIAFNNQTTGTENNLDGTVTITNNTLTNARWHGIMIQNFNGTIADAVVTGNTITSSTSLASSLGYAINFQILGSATTASNLTKANISSNTITNFPSAGGIQVQGGNSNAAGPNGTIGTPGNATNIISITNNLVRGQSAANRMGTSCILFTVTGKGQGNVDISSNGTLANPLGNNTGTTIGVGANGNTTLTAVTNNNIIEANHPGTTGDSGISGGVGVTFGVTDVATMSWTINSNTITNVDGNGILAVARGTNGSLNVTIQNNNVEMPQAGVRPGIRVDAGNTTAGTDNDVCLDISGNTSAGSGGTQGIGLRKQGTSTTVHAFGVEGMAATSSPGVETYVAGLNPAGNGVLLISATSGFSNCAAAPLAPLVEDETSAKAPDRLVNNVPPAQAEQNGQTNAQAAAAPTLFAQLQQWLRPVFSAFASARSYVAIDRAFNNITPTAAAAELVAPLSGSTTNIPAPMMANLMANSAISSAALPKTGGTSNIPARTMIVNSRGEYRIVPTAALPKLMAGELITINGTGTGFTLPAGESTTVMFNAQIGSGFTGTSIANTANVNGSNFSQATDTETTTVVVPPTISKAFASDFVAKNGTVNLVFTINNPNPGTSFTQVAFSDVLPVGLNVTITGSTSQCSGTVATDTGTRTIALTGGSISAGGNCTITVPVAAGTTEGLLTNTSGTVSSFEGGTGGTANDTITVIDPPTLTKSFTPNSIPLNGTSTLQFTLSNPNTTLTLNTLSFTDTLPAGVTTPDVGATTVCTNGSYSVTANVLTFSKPSLLPGAPNNCTFSITVTGTTTGPKTNTTSTVTTTNSNAGTAATANLDVIAPPTISKAFGAASIPLYTSDPDTSFRTSLTFTITNPNSSGTLTGVGFSDMLQMGLVIANGPFSASGSCGPGGGISLSGTVGMNLFSASGLQVTAGTPCTVSLNVRGTTPGTKSNITSTITSTEGGTGTTSNTASIDVFAPPTVAKAFGASTISPGGQTTLTLTITNPAGNPGDLTGVTVTDNFPANLVAGTPALVSATGCGGTSTITDAGGGAFGTNDTGVRLNNGTVAVGTPCVVTVNVTSSMPGTYNNTTNAITSTNGGTGLTSNTATLIVAAPPTVAKSFSPNPILPGGTSTVTITLSNSNAGLDLTSAMLTDTLPAGVTTVNSTAATTCAGGTATQTSNSVSLSGGTIPQSGSCTLTVDVTAPTNGTFTNTISPGDLTTANSGPNSNTATATLTVADRPTISKAFAPVAITSGGTSTLTITLTNPNSNVPLTLSSPLTDTLPVNVTTVAATHANTCGGTSSQTGGSVTLTGGTIPVNSSCTLSVNVTSTTAGGHNNTIAAGALVTNGGTNANPATASLVVGAAPQVDKSFAATALKTGATTTMTIAITNNNGALSFNDVSYTDTLPTGLTVPDAAATPACGGTLTVASNVITLTGATIAAGANCTTTFTVTGATVGVKNNTVTVDTSNFGTGYTDTATVTVYDVPTIAKSFSPTSVPFGGTSTLSFVLSNPNSFSGGDLSGLAFGDTLPAGVTVATSGPTAVCGGTLNTTAPSTISFSGGTLGTAGPGNTCTISVTVSGTQLGMHTNTVTSLTSTQTGTNTVSASATLTVTQSPTTTTITNAATLASTPTVVGQPYAVNVTVAPSMGGMGTPTGTVNVSDGTGATCTITLSGGSGTCNLTSTTVGTPKTISATYVGDTNFATSSTTASHTVNKADTSLSSLTDSPDPSVVGQPYTVGFTLNVTAPGAGTPTGTVTVNDGAGGMCTATLPATSCQLTSTTQGAKTLTFTYSGDANFNGSTNTAGHGVNKADTTVTITDDMPDPSVFGQNYAVTASVSVNSPGSGTPTGTITVTDGTNNCTITLPGTSCNLPSTSVGVKTLTATYSGDANYNGSGPSAGVSHTVNKADVTVTITSDNPDSSAVGQNVTVAFTVAAAPPGAGTPTGNVTVTVSGGGETCTGALAAGSGSCTLALTVPGSRILTATYNSDTNFNTGTDTEPHTVVAPPSISKAFNPASVPVGQTSTLTFTITNPAANTVALTGVGFTDTFPNAPNLIVANPSGASLTGCGGATLTDNLGGALAPGDLGVMLSGATIGVGGTCTVTVNVTPQAQGMYNNVSGNVTSTNGGAGNTASATLSTNTPPTISSNNVSVKAGSNAAPFTIAFAADPDQPVNTLGITINGNPTTASSNGVTVSNVAIQANGNVTANIATTCAATTATFNLVVTDNQSATGTGTLTVTVTSNMPPILTYNATTVVAATTPTITPATGPSDNGTFTIGSVSVAPNNGGLGVLLNQSNGVVTILNAALIGTYTVTVPITDNCGATNNAQLIVTVVCPTLTLTPTSLPNGVQGTAYNQSVSAAPAGTTYSYAVTVNTLPPGLSLNSATGAITGTPTAGGNYAFGITATGWGGCTKTQSYNLLITGTCATITLNPTTLPAGTIGTAYSQTITATGGIAPYTFAVTQGALPAGLTLDTNTGALTGTPTAGGSFSFRITATGQGGCTGSRTYVLTVTCPTLTFNPASLPSGTRNVAYSQTISITQAGTYAFSLLVGSLPPGFTLSSAGVLSGVTSQTGTFNFTVKAVGGTCQGTKAYSLVISSGAAAMAQMADYNGDGKSDFALWSPTGAWRLSLSTASGAGAQRQTQTQSWGTKGDLTLLGDYDGDGQTDLAVFRPANGTWYIKHSGNGSEQVKAWGTADDVPVPGDYDGDGRTDIAVFRPSEGNWYVLRSSDQQNAMTAWGAGYAPYNDVAVPGDYDGDGRTDLAVFRRATSTWLVKRSSDGQFTAKAWGTATDVPVAADYDGDGQTDFAVWRAGAWYIWQSARGSLRVEEWGASAAPYFDRTAPGDYDGDGQADITVWRAGDQTWYVRCSVDGSVMSQAHGQAGDRPVTDNK